MPRLTDIHPLPWQMLDTGDLIDAKDQPIGFFTFADGKTFGTGDDREEELLDILNDALDAYGIINPDGPEK